MSICQPGINLLKESSFIKHTLKDKDFFELLKGGGISFFLRFGGLAMGYLLRRRIP